MWNFVEHNVCLTGPVDRAAEIPPEKPNSYVDIQPLSVEAPCNVRDVVDDGGGIPVENPNSYMKITPPPVVAPFVETDFDGATDSRRIPTENPNSYVNIATLSVKAPFVDGVDKIPAENPNRCIKIPPLPFEASFIGTDFDAAVDDVGKFPAENPDSYVDIPTLPDADGGEIPVENPKDIHSPASVNKKDLRTCTICGRELYRGSMAQHMRTHAVTTPAYPCDLCQRTFRHSGSLNRHRRTHLNTDS